MVSSYGFSFQMCVVRSPSRSCYCLVNVCLLGKVNYLFLDSRCMAAVCSNFQRVAFQTAVSQLCLEVVKIFRRRFGREIWREISTMVVWQWQQLGSEPHSGRCCMCSEGEAAWKCSRIQPRKRCPNHGDKAQVKHGGIHWCVQGGAQQTCLKVGSSTRQGAAPASHGRERGKLPAVSLLCISPRTLCICFNNEQPWLFLFKGRHKSPDSA